ncbi:hypothetical protein V8J82_22055 [Gymnodinialimonas sp. 2305UL16-5]|uniref:hypothetical protein n=1 Tax=Gymnodinialimonas mytili TaxID=3126503 RepID=UPI0030AFB660
MSIAVSENPTADLQEEVMNDRFVRIVLKKSVFEAPLGEASTAWLFLSAHRFWLRDQLCEFAKVLSCGCELELFVCALWSS